MKFTDLTKEKIIEVASGDLKNRELVLFFDFIRYEPQLFLLDNENALNILKLIYKCGGAVRRTDLIRIIFNGDKKIYELINKMIELKLLNIEGQRDSIIGLTSISLSILKGKRIKNSIKISQFTSNLLNKAEFIMRCNHNGIVVENDTKLSLDAYIMKYKNLSKVNELGKLCVKTLESCKENNVLISEDLKELVIYALDEKDFYKKMNNINSVEFPLSSLRFNIEKIILPAYNFEDKIDIKSFTDRYKDNQSICYDENVFNTILIEYI